MPPHFPSFPKPGVQLGVQFYPYFYNSGGTLMAHLKKRGKVYYVRFKGVETHGDTKSVTKSLRTKHKDVAQQMLKQLNKLEELGKIDPAVPNFDPVKIIQKANKPDKRYCNTVREAADKFYQAKSYRSKATIGAYERAIEHFIEFNNLEEVDPRNILQEHFEAIIFKPGIKTATAHYYFRHYRAWWNWLLKKKLVDQDFFDEIREDLPEKRVQTRPKMISEDELKLLFKAYDEELERKKELPEFKEDQVQHWFKPIIAIYFYAGLRRNEVAYSPELPYSGLKGENLIYEGNELAYIYLPPTKGRKERQVPIIKELQTILNEYLSIREPIKPNEYVFVYRHGITKGKPVLGERVYTEFKRYADIAGLPSTRSLHGMRHQAITTWIERGFNTAEAGYMAGHSSTKVTEKYTHLTAKRLKDKMDGL